MKTAKRLSITFPKLKRSFKGISWILMMTLTLVSSCRSAPAPLKNIPDPPALSYGWIKDDNVWTIDGRDYDAFCMVRQDKEKLMNYLYLIQFNLRLLGGK